MANTKSKKPARPTAPKSTKTPSPAAASGTPGTRADKVLSTLSPQWPALTTAQRTTYAARYPNARCEEMGTRTRSEGVVADALSWAPLMAKTLKAHPETLRRYSAERFSWFLTCTRALVDERTLQQTKGGAIATAKIQAGQAQSAALAARAELLETLEELVDGNEGEESALSAAVGTIDRPDRIVTSIGDLAALARGWLKRADDPSQELIKSAGLTLAEVETAETAAEALASAGADKTLEGRVELRDTPPVNRVEGRLLFEMKAALRVFNRANARNKDVPKLTPGDATRAVLAPRPTKPVKAPKDPGPNG